MKINFIRQILIVTLLLLVLLTGTSGAAPACVAQDGTAFFGGDTVFMSCTLNGSMVCPHEGLTIGADGVIIDGNGYAITGSATSSDCEWCSEVVPCSVSGIYNVGHDDVVIRNIEISGFCTGIALAGIGADAVRNTTITNCRIHNNGFNITSGISEIVTHGIHACRMEGSEDVPALTITENEIYNNKGTGGGCGDGGNGIFIYAGGSGNAHEYCNISYNRLHDNAKSGFWTKMMLSKSNITNNEVWGNGDGAGITDDVRGGIILRCKKSSNNLIADNNVSNNVGAGAGYGIYVGGCSNLIRNNTVAENTADGISMGRSDGSSHNQVQGNTVCENGRYGISASGGTQNNSLHNNTIANNGQRDVYDTSGELSGDHNTCDTAHLYCDDSADCPPPCVYHSGSWGPDLVISELEPSWIVSGVNYTIDYMVCNLGRGVVANASKTGIYINETLLPYDEVPELGVSECYSNKLGPFQSSGIDTIRLCADGTNNETRDVSKKNNNLTDVFGGPDLVITSFDEIWVDLPQKKYNLTYTVKNVGDLPTPWKCWTNFTELHGEWGSIDPVPVPVLDVGESVTQIAGPFTMEGDTDWLEAWVNFNRTFDENINDDLHGNRARFMPSYPAPSPLPDGDLNGDGKITPADAVIALEMAVRGEYSEEADLSGDHKVTSLDALMILQVAAAD